jgi:N-acetylmuramoyl-L-alanine amidase
MRRWYFIVSFLPFVFYSQNMKQCKYRFDTYLNFRGSLNGLVKFDENAISIYHNGVKEFSIYSSELEMLSEFFEHTNLKQQEELLKLKGNKKYTRRQKDSVWIYVDDRKKLPKKRRGLPLQGCRVAIDPGHFGTNLNDALIEGKYLYFAKDSVNSPLDTVKIFESTLTFNTALLIKKMLEEQGASVLLTRDRSDHTSFNCTYQAWLSIHRQKTLDSLMEAGNISLEKRNKLLKEDDQKFFWDFFRDWDLLNRAAKMNKFNPHVTAIVHYNVDEKNDPWKKTTDKDFTMAFIGGAFTSDNFEKSETRIHFLRLLLTKQLNNSEKVSAVTVSNFNKLLNVPVAGQFDATYLKDNCLLTESKGVFSRNLILCRLVNSVIVYGEALYQDNRNESIELMKNDMEKYGIRTNQTLIKSATAYFNGIYTYLKTM